jgi:fibronectin-binding autotransporter adhesin
VGVIKNTNTYVALTKAGNGTQVLSGANTYTGATTISNGTLQIGNAGTTGAISNSSAVTDNAMLTFNRTDTYTYTGTITGTGGALTQAGSGTLELLTASNSYTGGTIINAGTLQVGDNATPSTENVAALGTGTVTVNSGAILYYMPGSTTNTYNITNAFTLNGGTIKGRRWRPTPGKRRCSLYHRRIRRHHHVGLEHQGCFTSTARCRELPH